jgi:single-strand DNA-binding protein
MQGLNRVMLLGNLGADPELRMTQGGQAVLNMRLATTEQWKSEKGGKQERTDWHSCVLWGKRAEALGKILHKGDRILVEGKLRHDSYDDRDGNKRYRTTVNVTEVLLQGSKSGAKREPERERESAPDQDPHNMAGWEDDDEIPF